MLNLQIKMSAILLSWVIVTIEIAQKEVREMNMYKMYTHVNRTKLKDGNNTVANTSHTHVANNKSKKLYLVNIYYGPEQGYHTSQLNTSDWTI